MPNAKVTKVAHDSLPRALIKIAHKNGSCAQDAVVTVVADQYRNLLICSAICSQQAPAASFAGLFILIMLLYLFLQLWRRHGGTALFKSMTEQLQPIPDRVAQHLEIMSQNFQFNTRRTRILMGFVIYYLALILNPMGRILVRWKSFRDNLEVLCHPICNWLYVEGKIWDHPSQTTQKNDQILGVGISYGTKKKPPGNWCIVFHSFLLFKDLQETRISKS